MFFVCHSYSLGFLQFSVSWTISGGKKRRTLHANLVDKLHRFTVPTGSPLPRDFLARGLRRRREEEKKRRREEEKKRREEERKVARTSFSCGEKAGAEWYALSE